MGLKGMTLRAAFIVLTLWRSSQANIGYFWQISDLHLDLNYSSSGSRDRMCWRKNGAAYRSAEGRFGDYGCDSPLTLVKSAIKAMKRVTHKEIEFILWTGDSIAYSTYKDRNVDNETIFSIVRNITTLLEVEFPYANIYPVLGNTDWFPEKEMEVSHKEFHERLFNYSQQWSKWVPPESMDTFRKGGYYAIEQRNRKLRLLILNTSLYTKRPWLLSTTEDDPAEQFAWLRTMLSKAKAKGETVYIIGHVPPGKMERYMSSRLGYDAYSPHFNKKYLKLVRDYHSVIAGQFFGHFHSDSFRVFYKKKDATRGGKFLDRTPISYLFISPAVSPRKSVIADEIGPNNPGLRLYQYNKSTGQVYDYTQYYLNLSMANEIKRDHWKILYNLTSYYRLPNVSAESLSDLAFSFLKRSGNAQFLKYYFANSVGYEDPKSCTNLCRRTHFCVITNIDYLEYERCIQTVFGGAESPSQATKMSLSVTLFTIFLNFFDIWSP